MKKMIKLANFLGQQIGICDAFAIFAYVTALALTMIFVSCAFAQSPDNARDKHADNLDKLIDAIASRNKVPKIVKIDEKYRTPWFPGRHSVYAIIQTNDVPIFSTDYDWADQERVLKAIMELDKKEGDDLWPRLVEHIGDLRYSVTCSEQDDTVHNWSVGRICRLVALRGLCVYEEYDRFKDTQPIYIDTDDGKVEERLPVMFNFYLLKRCQPNDLKAWYSARKGKPLYELQIEICESAITKMQDDKEDPKAVKDLFIEPVRKEIQVLKETKKPILRKNPSLPFYFDPRFFDAKMAKELRDNYEAQQKAEAEKVNK